MIDPNKTMHRDNCDRCHEVIKPGESTIMSMFNNEVICTVCKEKEKNEVEYRAAVEADHAAIRKGDYNFPGIGRPGFNKKLPH